MSVVEGVSLFVISVIKMNLVTQTYYSSVCWTSRFYLYLDFENFCKLDLVYPLMQSKFSCSFSKLCMHCIVAYYWTWDESKGNNDLCVYPWMGRSYIRVFITILLRYYYFQSMSLIHLTGWNDFHPSPSRSSNRIIIRSILIYVLKKNAYLKVWYAVILKAHCAHFKK